jgi:hypothetical protein
MHKKADFKQKLGILTADATTPYMAAFPNLQETGHGLRNSADRLRRVV